MDVNKGKKLMLAYKVNPTKETFRELLEFADPHLVTCVKVLQSKYPPLQHEDPQDLYHCAIIALHKACLSLTAEHDVNMIDTRIYMYTKEEVFRFCNFDEAPHKSLEEDIPIEDTQVQFSLLFQDFQEQIERLIEQKIIKKRDYDLLVRKFMYGQTYKNIAKQTGLHQDTVRMSILRTLAIIRKRIKI